MHLPKARSADIALLLDGTFADMGGGVSDWVDQMVRAFPQYRFALVLIGDRRHDHGAMADALPDNVVHVDTHGLHEPPPDGLPRSGDADAGAFARVARLHDLLRQCGTAAAAPASMWIAAGTVGQGDAQIAALMRELIGGLGHDGGLSEHAFLHSRLAWDSMVERYRRHCPDSAFSDYVGAVRTLHRPLWRLARIAADMIPARVYHTVSTGYAGCLGAMLRHRHGRPLLVSEHGGADMSPASPRPDWPAPYVDDLRLRFFEALGRLCYDAADDIVALSEGERRRQLIAGAPARRTRTIPVGVDVRALAPLRQRRPAGVPPVLCLAGPVVPGKDVKTFIRAMLTVLRHRPDARGWIVGAEDQDPEYARQCRSLAQALGLAGKVEFLGERRIAELLPRTGVLVQSSLGETLPLPLLQGFAAGVPCVATDVGACRELVYGAGEEDVALGAAGAVVRVADAAALAHEAVALLTDASRWYAAQQSAIARVERYYTQQAMVAGYAQLYQRLIARPDANGAPGRPRPAPDAGEGEGEHALAARGAVAGAH